MRELEEERLPQEPELEKKADANEYSAEESRLVDSDSQLIRQDEREELEDDDMTEVRAMDEMGQDEAEDGDDHDEGETEEEGEAEEESDDNGAKDPLAASTSGVHRRPGHRKLEPYRIHMRARSHPRSPTRRAHPIVKRNATAANSTQTAQRGGHARLSKNAHEFLQIMKTASSSVVVVEDSDKDSDGVESVIDRATALKQLDEAAKGQPREDHRRRLESRRAVLKVPVPLNARVGTRGHDAEHGRWLYGRNGWSFVRSGSCGKGNHTHVVCESLGADARLREILKVPEGTANSPNDTALVFVAKSESPWKHVLDKFTRSKICQTGQRHLAPYWCKTEAGVGRDANLALSLDAAEDRWQKQAVRREQIKADLLTVIQMREEFSLRATVEEGEWAEKLARIEEERNILREKVLELERREQNVEKEKRQASEKLMASEQEFSGLNEALRVVEKEEASAWRGVEERREEVKKIRNFNKEEYLEWSKEKGRGS
mmetsp:Transcript_11085/g.23123  ORF Transcript_11085/g.23123 Transcript_11085/m.23123 type:complete len:489 (-) Transcript_11085:176-1642(-)